MTSFPGRLSQNVTKNHSRKKIRNSIVRNIVSTSFFCYIYSKFTFTIDSLFTVCFLSYLRELRHASGCKLRTKPYPFCLPSRWHILTECIRSHCRWCCKWEQITIAISWSLWCDQRRAHVTIPGCTWCNQGRVQKCSGSWHVVNRIRTFVLHNELLL